MGSVKLLSVIAFLLVFMLAPFFEENGTDDGNGSLVSNLTGTGGIDPINETLLLLEFNLTENGTGTENGTLLPETIPAENETALPELNLTENGTLPANETIPLGLNLTENETIAPELNLSENETLGLNLTENATLELNLTENGTALLGLNLSENTTLELNFTENTTLGLNLTVNETILQETNNSSSGKSTLTLELSNETATSATQGDAIAGEPVAWSAQIDPSAENLTFAIPQEAENISIQLPSAENVSFSAPGAGAIEPTVIEQETSQLVMLESPSEKMEISFDSPSDALPGPISLTYQTPAPQVEELNLSENQKQVTISSDTHYTEILTRATLPAEVSSKEQVSLSGEGSPDFTLIDTDANGLYDTIEWVVPSLSTKTYIISINILNVHSNPTLGGNWSVDFTTTGTANLNITASIDPSYYPFPTRWSNESEDPSLYDLRALSLTCAGEPVAYQWLGENCEANECSVFAENYSCASIGTLTSKVLTEKPHVLSFRFGGEQEFAYNNVTNVSVCATLNVSGENYTLNSSVSANGSTCFTVSAASVTIDCNGFSITGNNTASTYGVYSASAGTIVKNCNISGFQYGIYFNGATSGIISNTTISTNYSSGRGINFAAGTNYNTILNTSSTSASGYGIYMFRALGNKVTFTNASSTSSAGLYYQCDQSNTVGANFTNSSFTSGSGYGAQFAGSWMDEIANINMTGCNITSTTNIGLAVSGTVRWATLPVSVVNSTVSGNPYDFYSNFCSNIVFLNNTGKSGKPTAYYNNQSAALGGFTNHSSILFCNADSSNVSNITAENIILMSTDNASFSNVSANSTIGYGIYLTGSTYNTLSNASGYSNTSFGIYVASSSTFNRFIDSNGTSDSNYGVYLESSSNNNTFDNVAATSNSGIAFGFGVWTSGSVYSTNISNSRITSNSSNAVRFDVNTINRYINFTNTVITSNVSSNGVIYDIGAVGNIYRNVTVVATGAANAYSCTPTWGATSSSFINSNLTAASGSGISTSCGSHTIANSSISSASGTAISLGGSSSTVSNNTFLSLNGAGTLLSVTAGSNTFYWNNFTNTSGYYVQDSSGANSYNTSIGGRAAGNIWHNVLNGSVQVSGAYASPFSGLYYGTRGNGYPYNNTTAGGKLSGNVVDRAPLTDQMLSLPTTNASYILPAAAFTSAPLQGYCTALASESTNLSFNYVWYLNGAVNASGTTNSSVPAGTGASGTATGGTTSTVSERGIYYRVHTFTSSGTFSVNGTVNATVLVVAGGGGGGAFGGGGGGGGVIYNDSYIATGNISVVVGAGGAGDQTQASGLNGTPGQNSSFGTLNANGGGGGGTRTGAPWVAKPGTPGGSGGGGSPGDSGNYSGGVATPSGQGNNGGNGAANWQSGGGGGAGAAGGNATGSASGNGGAGANYSINGTNTYYAGGGGGGAYSRTAGSGGLGGGANGSASGSGLNGTNGTGGGGGGSTYGAGVGGNGGSGIVIVRYPVAFVENVANVSAASLSVGQNWTLECTALNSNGSGSALNSSVTAINMDCGTLGTAGTTYLLSASVSISGATCFNITAQNVTLDCNGYSITGNNSSGAYGIYSSQNFTNIRNCNISNFESGVYFNGASNGTINASNISASRNNVVAPLYSSAIAFYNGSSYNTVNGCNLYSTYGAQIATNTNAINNTFSRVNGTAGWTGARFDTVGNVINGSNVSGQTNGVYAAGYNLVANSSIWSNTSTAVYPTGGAYFLNDNITSVTGGGVNLAWSYNNYFIDSNISTYSGNAVWEHYVSGNNFTRCNIASTTGVGFAIGSDSSTILRDSSVIGGSTDFSMNAVADCSGMSASNLTGRGGLPHYFTNTPGNYSNLGNLASLILCNADRSNVTNATAESVELFFTDNSTIVNVSANKSTGPGYYVSTSTWNTFSDSSAFSNSSYGVYPDSITGSGSVYNNFLRMNISSNTSAGAYTTGRYNNFTACNITSTTGNAVVSQYGYNNFINSTLAATAGTGSTYGVGYSSGYDYFNGVTGTAAGGAALWQGDGNSGCNLTIINSNFTSATSDGIHLWYSCNGNTLINTTGTSLGSGVGVFLHGSSSNTVRNVTAISSSGTGFFFGYNGWGHPSNYNSVVGLTATSTSGTGIDCQGGQLNSLSNVSGASGSGVGILASSVCANVAWYNATASSNSNAAVSLAGSGNLSFTGLTASSSSGHGVSITAGSNMTIDCAGGSITGRNASGAYGVYTSQNNISVYNCTISNFTNAIRLNGAKNGTFTNNTLVPNEARTNTLLVVTGASSGNTFYWNNFTNTSGYYVNDTNGSNHYNTSFSGQPAGNLWHNIWNGSVQAVGSVFTPFTGLYYGASGSGYPYNNTTAAGKVLGNIVDRGPLTNQYDPCGSPYSVAGTVVNMLPGGSYTGSGTCINVTAPNITINCSGSTITGNNAASSYGVYSNQYNTTIIGCVLTNFTNAIYLEGATNGTFRNNTFIPNDARTNGLVYVNGSASGNTFYFNNFTNTSGYFVTDLNGSNNYNASVGGIAQGNFYYNITSYAIFDANNDTWGDAGVNYPFNATNAPGAWVGGGSDFGPGGARVNHRPNISAIALFPAVVYGNDTLFCNVTGTDEDQANLTIFFEWYNNSANVSAFAGSSFVYNNTAAFVSNITGMRKGETWQCVARAYDQMNLSNWSSSNNVTISNLALRIEHQTSFSNASAGHWFNATAGVFDLDGASDIAATNISATSGSCSYLSNSTSGNYFNVTYNCTAVAPGTADVIIGFSDTGDYVETNISSNTYPDNAPTLTNITVSSPLFTNSIASCNGTFFDIDSDTENASSRAFVWYRNGTAIAGESAITLNMTLHWVLNGENISCYENASSNIWAQYTAQNTSPNETAVQGCGVLNATGANYSLSRNVSINGATCFNIAAANITLDCRGYSIIGNGTGATYGILSSQFNTTAKNCAISSFQNGIYLSGATNSTIENVSASTAVAGGNGILVEQGSGIALTNANGTATSGSGIKLADSNASVFSSARGISTSSYGIFINNAPNSSFANLNGTSSSGTGVYINATNSSTFTGLNGTSTSSMGVSLFASSYNAIRNLVGISHGGAYGVSFLSGSDSNTVLNISGSSSSTYGIAVNASSNNSLLNSTVQSTLLLTNSALDTRMVNSQFAPANITFGDSASNLSVEWYAYVHVHGLANESIEGAPVRAANLLGANATNGTTGADGNATLQIPQYVQNSTGSITLTPHNFTATHPGNGLSNTTNATMDASKAVEIGVISASVNITMPNQSQVFYQGDTVRIVVNETLGQSYIFNVTVSVRGDSLNGTYQMAETSPDLWEYNYTVSPAQRPATLNITANGYVGDGVIHSSRTIITTKHGSTVLPPVMAYYCPDFAYLANNSTANISASLDLDTILYSYSLNATYPDNASYILSPSANSSDLDEYVYNYTWLLPVNQTGTYSLFLAAEDANNQTVNRTVHLRVSPQNSTLNLSATGTILLSLSDSCSGKVVADGSSLVGAYVPPGNYTLYAQAAHSNITLESFNVTSFNGTFLSHSEIYPSGLPRPENRRNVYTISAATLGGDFANATLTMNYSYFNGSLIAEASLELHQCTNTSSCGWERQNATLSINSSSIRLTSAGLFGYYGIFEPAYPTPQYITVSSGGGGSSTRYVDRNVTHNVTVYVPQEVRVEVPAAPFVPTRLFAQQDPLELHPNAFNEIPILISNVFGDDLGPVDLSIITEDGVNATIQPLTMNLSKGEYGTAMLKVGSGKPGKYVVKVVATAPSHNLQDEISVNVTVTPNTQDDKLLAKKRIDFADNLIRSNPECLDLRDNLATAAMLLDSGNFVAADSSAQNVISGCSGMMALRGKATVKTEFLPQVDMVLSVLAPLVAVAMVGAIGLAAYMLLRSKIHKRK